MGRILVLNSCLPFPKGQDISCGSGWRAEYYSVIRIPLISLSIIRSWGKMTVYIFLEFVAWKRMGYSDQSNCDQSNCGRKLRMMFALQS